MGTTGHGVYRSVDDENDITVWHDFASVAEAKALLKSDALKTAMANARRRGRANDLDHQPGVSEIKPKEASLRFGTRC